MTLTTYRYPWRSILMLPLVATQELGCIRFDSSKISKSTHLSSSKKNQTSRNFRPSKLPPTFSHPHEHIRTRSRHAMAHSSLSRVPRATSAASPCSAESTSSRGGCDSCQASDSSRELLSAMPWGLMWGEQTMGNRKTMAKKRERER